MNTIKLKNKIQIFSRKALLVTAVAICTLAVNPLAQTSTANADAKTSINPACGKRFAGSYLTTITGNIAGNNYFSRGVVTLTRLR